MFWNLRFLLKTNQYNKKTIGRNIAKFKELKSMQKFNLDLFIHFLIFCKYKSKISKNRH